MILSIHSDISDAMIYKFNNLIKLYSTRQISVFRSIQNIISNITILVDNDIYLNYKFYYLQ